MFATAPGCVVVLTGDFHFSDIKARYSKPKSVVYIVNLVLGFFIIHELQCSSFILIPLPGTSLSFIPVLTETSRFVLTLFIPWAQILQPGKRMYSDEYDSADLPRPLVQVRHTALAF